MAILHTIQSVPSYTQFNIGHPTHNSISGILHGQVVIERQPIPGAQASSDDKVGITPYWLVTCCLSLAGARNLLSWARNLLSRNLLSLSLSLSGGGWHLVRDDSQGLSPRHTYSALPHG